MDEQALKEVLLRENAEFRRVHDDHQACEKALDAIRAKAYLSAEADEERELKKRKLALKDRMYRLMSDRLRTT
jgi:uncharacterized protein YdcH (DUF465 family)